MLSCQLVCRRWKMLMNHVWHKKTERTLGKPFPWNDEMPWTVYYLACTRKPYERNLVKNHFGALYMKYWNLIQNGGDQWRVERPPAGIPDLPQTETLFKNRQIADCTYLRIMDLVLDGLPSSTVKRIDHIGSYWTGHYSSKMAGAYVCVRSP